MREFAKENLKYQYLAGSLFCNGPVDRSDIKFELDDETVAINHRAFKGVTIDTIIIPKNLEHIYQCAFFNSNIAEILFPERVFLEKGVFANSVINNIFLNTEKVSTEAFQDATIKNIKFKNTKVLDANSFRGAEITNIILPDTLKEISLNVFEYATFKNPILELPESVEVIRSDAFSHVNGLRKLILPKNIEFLSPNFMTDNKIKIITDPATISKFPFLNTLNTEVLDIDYFLEKNMSFKEINKALNRMAER